MHSGLLVQQLPRILLPSVLPLRFVHFLKKKSCIQKQKNKLLKVCRIKPIRRSRNSPTRPEQLSLLCLSSGKTLHPVTAGKRQLVSGRNLYKFISTRMIHPYLRKSVSLLELRNRERSHVVAHLLSGFDGSLHQPLSGFTHHTFTTTSYERQSLRQLSHLDHWENVDKIQALDLMRLQAVRALHLWKHGHDFLGQSSVKKTYGDEEPDISVILLKPVRR